MASFAVSFLSVLSGDSLSPQKVFLPSNSLKMCWVAAKSISAKMVYVQSFRDFSFNKLIGKSMGIVAFNTNLELSITVPFFAAPSACFPQPATRRLINFVPKSLFNAFSHMRMIKLILHKCKYKVIQFKKGLAPCM